MSMKAGVLKHTFDERGLLTREETEALFAEVERLQARNDSQARTHATLSRIAERAEAREGDVRDDLAELRSVVRHACDNLRERYGSREKPLPEEVLWLEDALPPREGRL